MSHKFLFLIMIYLSITGLANDFPVFGKIDNIDDAPVCVDTIDHKQETPLMNPEDRQKVMIDKYGKNKGKLIAQGKVWQTISTEMAIDSWGKPEKVQRSEVSSGYTEKWSYPEKKYLFFKNGRLESWKE